MISATGRRHAVHLAEEQVGPGVARVSPRPRSRRRGSRPRTGRASRARCPALTWSRGDSDSGGRGSLSTSVAGGYARSRSRLLPQSKRFSSLGSMWAAFWYSSAAPRRFPAASSASPSRCGRRRCRAAAAGRGGPRRPVLGPRLKEAGRSLQLPVGRCVRGLRSVRGGAAATARRAPVRATPVATGSPVQFDTQLYLPPVVRGRRDLPERRPVGEVRRRRELEGRGVS